ncbi:hypothetical protein [Streptomyces sp. NPDC051211]|uniref:hypothetical protein n=1 Tax=Streptomyces sp. NPDC051211 TaxID=3154643 RepID=UPI00344DA7E1
MSIVALPTINISGDPLADLGDSLAGKTPKILAEVYSGSKRLVMYTGGDACGFTTITEDGSQVSPIHLSSTWPSKGEGHTDYSAGPYNTASGSGDSTAWASMACGKNAMVIEYSPRIPMEVSRARGQVTIERKPGHPLTLVLIVGETKVREEIASHLPRG